MINGSHLACTKRCEQTLEAALLRCARPALPLMNMTSSIVVVGLLTAAVFALPQTPPAPAASDLGVATSAASNAQVADVTAPIGTDPDDLDPASLENAAIEAFEAGQFERARSLLKAQIEASPQSSVPHYNLACVLAAMAQSEEELLGAMSSVLKAVELGFADRFQLEQDPHLAPLRDLPSFRQLVDRWPEVLDARAEAQADRLLTMFGRGYIHERDDEQRLLFASGFTPESLRDAQLEIDAVTHLARERVFNPAGPAQEAEAGLTPWVSIILPMPAHFQKWQIATFGARPMHAASQIGGFYDHDTKELWAADLGATLRHEFFHVIHWRDMQARHQRHPMWIQEGLAALVETVDERGHPAPCWRTNLIRRHAVTNNLVPLELFTGDVGQRLLRDQPLRFYAQSRALFLWLDELGVLPSFYAAYTGTYREDPSGVSALLASLKLTDLGQADAALRSWAIGLPEVPTEIEPGMAILGVRIDAAGTGEGLKVTGFPGRRPEGLRLGDVITHVAGRPTRDYYELVRVLSGRSPGETVPLKIRRRQAHTELEITLGEAR